MARGQGVIQRARTLLAACTVLVGVSSCAYVPVPVEGVDASPEIRRERGETPWIFVPTGAWLTRDTVSPRAFGLCAADECPWRVAVAVFEARGAEARALSATVADPARLVPLLQNGNTARRQRVAEANRTVPADVAARRMPRRIAAATERFGHRDMAGFVLTLHAVEGSARVAHAAVLTRRQPGRVLAVVVVGDSATGVREAARAVADGETAAHPAGGRRRG